MHYNLHLPAQPDWYKKATRMRSTDSFKCTKLTYIYPHNRTDTKKHIESAVDVMS